MKFESDTHLMDYNEFLSSGLQSDIDIFSIQPFLERYKEEYRSLVNAGQYTPARTTPHHPVARLAEFEANTLAQDDQATTLEGAYPSFVNWNSANF